MEEVVVDVEVDEVGSGAGATEVVLMMVGSGAGMLTDGTLTAGWGAWEVGTGAQVELVDSEVGAGGAGGALVADVVSAGAGAALVVSAGTGRAVTVGAWLGMTVVVTSTVVQTTLVTVSHTTGLLSRFWRGRAELRAAKKAPVRARVLVIGAIVMVCFWYTAGMNRVCDCKDGKDCGGWGERMCLLPIHKEGVDPATNSQEALHSSDDERTRPEGRLKRTARDRERLTKEWRYRGKKKKCDENGGRRSFKY